MQRGGFWQGLAMWRRVQHASLGKGLPKNTWALRLFEVGLKSDRPSGGEKKDGNETCSGLWSCKRLGRQGVARQGRGRIQGVPTRQVSFVEERRGGERNRAPDRHEPPRARISCLILPWDFTLKKKRKLKNCGSHDRS